MAATAFLPDFGSPFTAGESIGYALIGGGQGVVPGGFAIATDGVGAPRLTLVLEKRADDLSAASRGAVLDVTVAAQYGLDEALAAARDSDPAATVRALPIDLGFARLIPAGSALGFDELALVAQPLGWAAADAARWTQRLSPAAGGLIKGALAAGKLPFVVGVDFTVAGMVPRAPVRVGFDAAAVVATLAAGTSATAYTGLLAVLAAPGMAQRFAVDGDVDEQSLAAILRDRLVASYGAIRPAATAAAGLEVLWTLPAAGPVIWDLAVPAVVSRGFSAQAELAAGTDPARLPACVGELVVPPLDIGLHRIEVAANLPPHRVGIPAIGVRIDAPARPPARPSAIAATMMLTEPADSADVTLGLAPGETLAFTLTPFAVLAAGRDAAEVDGAATDLSDDRVALGTADFPLTFAHVSASSRLLALARVEGALSYDQPGPRRFVQAVSLDAARPDATVALPATAAGTLALALVSIDGGISIDLGSQLPGRVALDLPMLPGYGPHRVRVNADLRPGDAPLALAFVSADGANPAPMILTAAEPASIWGYVAASPFAAGYRWRIGDGSWTDVADFAAPLIIGRAMIPPPPLPAEVDGVRLFANPSEPATIYYLPPAPIAADDGGGRPAVNLVRTAAMTMLSIGARFAVDAATLTDLAAKLNVAPAALQPLPVTVDGVALKIVQPDGSEINVAQSSSSGFPPWSAALAAQLQAGDADRAMSAVNGGAGHLFVDYAVTPQSPNTALPAARHFRVDVAAWFPQRSGADHIQIIN